MDLNIVRWGVDLSMGITFVICFITGILKFTPFLEITGLNNVILPAAYISDLHDWTGLLLGLFVFIHLFINRNWIISMTKKILK